jgi:hypothetical protein
MKSRIAIAATVIFTIAAPVSSAHASFLGDVARHSARVIAADAKKAVNKARNVARFGEVAARCILKRNTPGC